MADSPARRAHLNLVESSRLLFELDPGAETETGDGLMLGAGSVDNAMITSAAFRTDDGLDPDEFLTRAREFFATRRRGFTVWARGGIDEDRELIAAAEATGFRDVYAMPEMILGAPAEQPPLAEGVAIRRLESAADAAVYWEIAATAYADIGFPPEVFGHYEGLERLCAPGRPAAAFLADLDGAPAGIAMTIVNHGVAGIYWVGNLAEARGRGIGRAVTAAATDAGFELGADFASLQASPMGAPVYLSMGFETIFDYRLLLSPGS